MDLRKKIHKCMVESQNFKGDGDIVPEAEGIAMAQRIGAAAYVECSAKTGEGVDSVFDAAVATVLAPKPNKLARLLRQSSALISPLTEGTRSPFFMMALRRSPRSDPDLTSARSKSPEERCV